MSVERTFVNALVWFTALCNLLPKFAPNQSRFAQTSFSRARRRLHAFTSGFDWFIVLFASAVISHVNYFGLVLRRSNKNCTALLSSLCLNTKLSDKLLTKRPGQLVST